jgi:hypothetical protein
VLGARILEDLQYAHARMRHFQPGTPQFFASLFHDDTIWAARSKP